MRILFHSTVVVVRLKVASASENVAARKLQINGAAGLQLGVIDEARERNDKVGHESARY